MSGEPKNVTISGNYAGDDGGGIECRDCCSPSIENVTITGNTAASAGGGLTCLYGSAPNITNVIISGNWSGCYVIGGGGIWFGESGNAILTNVMITGNTARLYGGGIDCKSSSPGCPSLINVTISGNTLFGGWHPVLFGGAGIRCWRASPSLVNCIVSDNTGDYGIYVMHNEGNPSISYSDFWNNELGNFRNCDELIGVNVTTNANGDSCDVYYNIQLDPLFFDLENGDVHLTAYSPCIDAGTPDTTGLNLPEYDLDGNPRIYNGIIDIVADEECQQYGSIEGYVTQLDGGAPIEEGAEITFIQYTGFTNGDGYYIIDSLLISELVGSYTFTCHKEGYIDTLSEGVEILFDYTTTCNFEMITSTMVIDPLSINESIAPGEVLTTYITISNNGNAPLNYSISVVQDSKQRTPIYLVKHTDRTLVTEKNVKPENRITGESAKVEFSVSPECLSRKSFNNSATIGSNVSGWYSVANKSGNTNVRLDEWYSYGDMNALWWLTWIAPERVTYFNPADFGLTYPFDITKVNHWFHDYYPWDDATFRYKIYADDGVTLLYESEDIEAQSMVEIVHELTIPVTITSEGFYFGVAPFSYSGYPSTCADNLYTGDNHSYCGSPGNWTLWSQSPDRGEFIQGVYLTPYPWMTVEPMSGTIEPGCVDIVDVTFDATFLEAGNIKIADIVITSFDPDVGMFTIPVQLEVTDVGVDDIPVTLSTKLNPNFPNPFCHSTTISFSCHRDTPILRSPDQIGTKGEENAEIIIYNIKGQKVKTLVNEKLNAGAHQIIWNGKDESGNPVSSGIYFYKFETTNKTFIKKMLLLR